MAAAVLGSGCKKKEADTGAGSATTGSAAMGSATVVVGSGGSAGDMAGSAGSAAQAAGSGAASKNPPPKIGTGDPASAEALAAIKIPTPKGVAATAKWKDASGTEVGERIASMDDGKDPVMMVRILDCRTSWLKPYITKAPDDRGELKYCFDAPTGQLKGFDLITGEAQHAVRAGNIVIIATKGPFGDKALKAEALDPFLEQFDLDAISKL